MTKGAWTDAVTIEAKTAALDGIKWLLWHGNAMDAIEDIECLADDVDADPDENSAAVSNVGQCAEHLGAHRLLQIRPRVLNGDLDELIRHRYPWFAKPQHTSRGSRWSGAPARHPCRARILRRTRFMRISGGHASRG